MTQSCPACSFANPQGQKFCGECGHALERACTQCGASIPSGFKFCGECGASLASPIAGSVGPAPRPQPYTPRHLAERILQSRSAVEGERKQVTVLFADIKGSMELAAQVGAETWHAILDRFFAILSEGVHRFEGTINQYTGDGIMALFGAPIALEDHVQRACYAALQLRDALRVYADELRTTHGIGFDVRFGLNAGEVIVGRIGDDLRMDYTAQGNVVGLAQRIEQLAEPGTALLTAAVADLVDGYVALRSLGEANIRGMPEPVALYALEGIGSARTRLDHARARGLSVFVGRQQEMDALDNALDHAARGSGRVVGVIAEAGTGKSRLCREFLDRCRAHGHEVYDAWCPQHGKTQTLVPILDLLRRCFRIEGDDSPQRAREKIAGRLLLLDSTFADELPLLFAFLGVPDPASAVPRLPPDERQRRLFSLLRRWVQLQSQRSVLIIAIDDLHWIDDVSDQYVAQLVEAANGTPTLVLLNFRPEYNAPWFRRSWYQQMPLSPLTVDATAQLLTSWIGRDPSLDGLAGRIHRQSAGNPFYTEELVRTLIESGQLAGSRGHCRLTRPLDRLQVPASVQAILQARIDRLDVRDKHVLQRAAVIGQAFDSTLIEAVAESPRAELDAALANLLQHEFLIEESIYPAVKYAFRHPLTRQVAEDSQLRETLNSTHARVADALERVDHDRLDEQAARIAWHRERAGDYLVAMRWHRRAALWIGVSDRLEEIRHWRSVLSLAATLDGEEPAELASEACWWMLSLAWRGLDVPRTEREALVERSRTLSGQIGHDRYLVRTLASASAAFHLLDADWAAARTSATEALELAQHCNDPVLELEAWHSLGVVAQINGELFLARSSFARVIEITGNNNAIRNAGDQLAYPVAGSLLASVEHQAGRHSTARLASRTALTAFALEDEPESAFWVLNIPAVVEAFLAGIDPAQFDRLEAAILHFAKRGGAPIFDTFGRFTLGMVASACGDPSTALSYLRDPLVLQGLMPSDRSLFHAGLSRALRASGELEEALEASRAGLSATVPTGGAVRECIPLLEYVECLLPQEFYDERAIANSLGRVESIIGDTGAEGYRPLLLETRAHWCERRGNSTEARALLDRACELYRDSGAEVHAERLRIELGF